MDNIAIINKIRHFFLELFFPAFCLGCNNEGSYLCPDCQSTLEISEYSYCLCSKNPLRLMPESDSGKCPRCDDRILSGLYFALPYQERFLTKKLIHQFKYEPYLKSLAKPLAELLIEHLVLARHNHENIWENSVLVPVPIDQKKLKHRDYNQSYELSLELANILEIPVVVNNLIKIKETLPQMKLGAKDRAKNLEDAFAIKNPDELKGKKVFLVDDVYTTGSTMEECARTLKYAGVKTVWGIAVARES